MRRALPLAALAGITACASAPPPPEPLTVRDPFPVTYDGRVSPLDADDLPTQGSQQEGDSAATLAPRRVVAFRATWIELSLADARALLPSLAAAPPPDVEPLPGGATRTWDDEFVSTRGPASASSSRRTRNLGIAAGHVEPAALNGALARLGDRASVVSRQQIAVGVGRTAELATWNQIAFIRSLRLAPAADSLLVDDVDVAVFQHGSRVAFAVAAQDGALRIDIDWRETIPVRPIPVGRTSRATLQIPVLERHRLTASTTVAGTDALVIASLPGNERGDVRVLCIEVDPSAPLAAGR